MLILGSKLIGIPIMGLQTGTKLALTKTAIINPSNLCIVAYEVAGPLLSIRPAYLRIADVRELSPVGLIIDGDDELIGKDDVIVIQKILDLNFNLIGMNVIDENKSKIGKIINYTVEAESFSIQQIMVKPNIIKSISKSELLIHRSQIVEINNSAIIVKSATVKPEQVKPSYVNPFRQQNPQTNNS